MSKKACLQQCRMDEKLIELTLACLELKTLEIILKVAVKCRATATQNPDSAK
jgi:hypothetical protein